MPRILANEHRRPAPRRIERAHAVAPLDESFLVEEPARREEVLAVHVQDPIRAAAVPAAGRFTPQLHVHEAVVEISLELFVKADYHVEGCRAGRGGPVRARERPREIVGGDRQLADTTFDEVSRERGLRELHDVRSWFERGRLREHLAYAAEISLEVSLTRMELGDCQVEERHADESSPPDESQATSRGVHLITDPDDASRLLAPRPRRPDPGVCARESAAAGHRRSKAGGGGLG